MDFVICLAPHNIHLPILESATKHKVNVLKEKPLARSLSEALEMQRLAKRAKIKVMVSLQRRFNTLNSDFVDMIGRLTSPFYSEFRYTKMIRNPNEGWRGQKACAGGGCTLDLGYHLVDMLIWYLGLPDRVCMESSTKAVEAKYDAEDTSAVLFGYDSGLYGSMLLSRAYSPETEQVRLTGSNGFCELLKESACFSEGNIIKKQLRKSYDIVGLVSDEIDYFANAIITGEKIKSSIEDNIPHMTFIESCYESERTKKYVLTKKVLGGAKSSNPVLEA